MNISMVGIDFNQAPIQVREKFSFTVAGSAKLGKKAVEEYGAKGCVVLSTCNRTEIWLSGYEGEPLELLLKEKGAERSSYGGFFTQRFSNEAVSYLLELGCGMHSLIFGEDQILTQLKTALQNARERGHSDPILETLFRMAVTAAKRVKTEVRLTAKNMSVPEGAIHKLEEQYGTLAGKRCMVIGNGEMGRLTSRLLVERQCHVQMTLRQYKTRDAVIPAGCQMVFYEDRYQWMGECDFIFSATLSPHFTVKKEDVKTVLESGKDYIFVDLAVPRDIEPTLSQLKGVSVWDVDQLGGTSQCDPDQIEAAEHILKEYAEEFYNWYYFREWIPSVDYISKTVAKVTDEKLTKVYKSMDLSIEGQQNLQNEIEKAASKAVSKVIFGLRDTLEMELWKPCIKGMEQSARRSR